MTFDALPVGGWFFPLPSGRKFPPPRGCTGRDAEPYVGPLGTANVGLRVPPGYAVLDLDDLATGLELALPATMKVRTPSGGIHAYCRCDRPLPGDIWHKGQHVGEVVHSGHRYVLVPPSDGYELLAEWACWDRLPVLPAGIIGGGGRQTGQRKRNRRSPGSEAEADTLLFGGGFELVIAPAAVDRADCISPQRHQNAV